jgi:(p)ppGpp synthase/HD superfamily hydrolase
MHGTYSQRFADALAMAYELHGRQRRKGSNIPYISHLMAVSALVLEHGGDEDEAIAALLHDAVEDQGGQPTLKRIEDTFGPRVGAIVAGCSDTDVVPKPPWRERKERYIAHVHTADASVRLVSSCDKLHNARTLLADYRLVGEALWSRFSASRDETLWYYRSLVDAYRSHGNSAVVDELERVLDDLDALIAARA